MAKAAAKAKIKRAADGEVVPFEVNGKKFVEFPYHALEQMGIRGITREEVLEAVKHPTTRGGATQPGRKRVRRKWHSTGKIIDVVYCEEDDRIVIVTTFPKPSL